MSASVPHVRIILAVSLWAICAALLLWSGRTFSAAYTSDIFAFWDGAQRVLDGQSPNLDFHYPLGPLSTLLPALGLAIGHSLGGMMPWATVILAGLVLPPLIYAAMRLPTGAAIGFILFILVLLMAPLVPGDHVEQMSFAMFYNRAGWALLAVLAVLLLPGGRPLWTVVAAAFLLILLVYLKVTFALVGFGIVALAGALQPERRKDALFVVCLALVAMLLVEAFWRGTAGYLSDLRFAAAASGAFRGTLWTVGRILVENLNAVLLFALIWIAALLRRADRNYLFLSAVLAAAGIPLLNQSAQLSGILTLVPAALLAVYAPALRKPGAEQLLAAVLALPLIVTHGLALSYHAVLSNRAQALAINGLAAPDGPNRLYLETVVDGVDLLRRQGISGGVATLDIANPFNVALGGRAPANLDLAPVLERTFSSRAWRRNMLADTAFVMVPKSPWHVATPPVLMRLLAVERDYRLVAASRYWHLYQKR